MTPRRSLKRRDLLSFPNKRNSLSEAIGVEVKVGAEDSNRASSEANQPLVGSSFAPLEEAWFCPAVVSHCRDNGNPAGRRDLEAPIISTSRAQVPP